MKCTVLSVVYINVPINTQDEDVVLLHSMVQTPQHGQCVHTKVTQATNILSVGSFSHFQNCAWAAAISFAPFDFQLSRDF